MQEVVAVTITHDYDDRLRSYELLADAFALKAPAAHPVLTATAG